MESYKTSVYVSQMSPSAHGALSTIVEELFKEANKIDVRSLQATSHDTYESVRSAHLKAAALATICDDSRLGTLLQNWSALQAIYIPQVKKKLFKSRDEFKEQVSEWKPEADKASELERERDAKWAAIQKLKAAPSVKELEEYHAAAAKAEEAKGYKTEYESAQKALSSLDKAVEDLDKIARLGGVESIHYHIPSADALISQLKSGEYKGISFEPFQMMKSGLVASVMAQQTPAAEDEAQAEPEAPATPLALQDKPKELSDLLKMKEAIDKMAVGRKFDAGYLRKLLPENDFTYSTKAVRSYVEDASAVFGVTFDNERREFTKIARPAISEQEFMGAILDYLKPSESSPVNEFYIRRALQKLRENCRAYEGFTVEDVYLIVREHDNFPISRKGVAVNLGKFSERYGVSYKENDEGKRIFTLKEIAATESQVSAIETVVKSFSFRQFSPDEACRAVFEKKLGVASPRLVKEVLEKKAGDFGIERIKDEPVMYRRIERPASAREELEKAHVNADDTAAF